MATAFSVGVAQIQAATRPEDLFGPLDGSAADQAAKLKRCFRRYSRLVHPDHQPRDRALVAEAAFKELSRLYEQALSAITDGRYGQAVTVQSPQHTYRVGAPRLGGDIADLYDAVMDDDRRVVLKLTRDPADHDLLQAEAETLGRLHQPDRPTSDAFRPFLPQVLDQFTYAPGGGVVRPANVLTLAEGFYSLSEVQAAYPTGVHPQDMAWMWRRLLYVLGYVHSRGVIHGAVLPPHVLIHPAHHGLMLVDWCYAVQTAVTGSSHVPAISTAYEAWYPAEVLNRQPPLPATDLLMAARCMLALLGGDPLTGHLPTTVPPALGAYFRACLLSRPIQRPGDAWKLLEEFDELIVRLWGPRRFRPFHLPVR